MRCEDGSRSALGGLSMVDDVKNESIRNLYTQPLPKSEKHDELMLNLTRQDVYEFVNYMWNDVYWLASLVIVMTFTGCVVSHHYDLRMRMVGAQMRIACCSLIYRKVSFRLNFPCGNYEKLHGISIHRCVRFDEFIIFSFLIPRDFAYRPYRQAEPAAVIL